MTNPQFKRLCALAREAAKSTGAKGQDQRKLRDLLVARTIAEIKQKLVQEYGRPA